MVKPVTPRSPEEELRFWLEHELTRLGASARAGFKVEKETARIREQLEALASQSAS